MYGKTFCSRKKQQKNVDKEIKLKHAALVGEWSRGVAHQTLVLSRVDNVNLPTRVENFGPRR